MEVDDAFHDRGVPYQIGGPAGAFGLIVVDGDPALATLTIDPGVEIRFYSAGSNIGGLFVGTSGSPVATGRLVAAGTAAAPILFTGAGGAPVAGSWEGITFFGALAAGNVLDHVQIDAAGDNGGDAGFGCPPAAFPETSGALKIFSPARELVPDQLDDLALEHARRLSRLDRSAGRLHGGQHLRRRRSSAIRSCRNRRCPRSARRIRSVRSEPRGVRQSSLSGWQLSRRFPQSPPPAPGGWFRSG